MTASAKRRRVLSNDDGWIIGTYGPPLTPDHLRDYMIAPHAGSPIDVFLWSIGGHEVYDYETEIGELFGSGYDNLDSGQQKRHDNLRQLIEEHGGPVTLIAQLCHEAGLEFFPSVRMNEHYDIPEDAVNYGRLRREHPELLIGRPGEDIPAGSLEWGIRTGLNYALPEVRAHMLAIICELIDRFDIDGIELDFMRHPAFFRLEEAYANRYLATDLVRQVRQRLDMRGAARGKKLDLAVRVPPTLADAARIGLDAGVWVREGLVDLLIAGGGFRPFEMPIGEFVEAARDTPCKVYGCLEALAGVLNEEKLRAIAQRYWEAGVDGLYLFNYYSLSNQWKREVLGKLADPATLARLDKRYELDQSSRERPTSQLGFSFRNAIPLAQLPVLLAPTRAERGAILHLDIADDVAGARADDALGTCTLGLNFARLSAGDELEVKLNQSPIPWTSGRTSSNTWTHTGYDAEWNKHPSKLSETPVEGDHIDFDLDGTQIKKGINELEVRLLRADPSHPGPLDLRDVRLSIRYK